MRILALLLLALAAPMIGQNDAEPYFALSSTRTFGSHGKPAIGLSAWNVKDLEFRVYRVNDPVKFFAQLENAHQFGGRTPPPPRERTLIERIHDWKRRLRADVRRNLRAQFTESPSAHFEKLLPGDTATARLSKETHFAEAPILNSQQLVMTFQQRVRSVNRWETQTVPINVPDQGVFLVEAVRGELRAYTILMVSDLVMITKNGRGRVVTFLADRTTGAPVAGAQLHMFGKEGKPVEARTNADGIAELPVPAGRTDDVRIVARNGNDTAVNSLASYAFSASREQWTGYLYTDRPVYRPGHTVHFKGILRLRGAAGYSVPAGRQVNVEIRDPEQKPAYQKTLTTTANGTIQDDLALPAAAALGNYFIEARAGEDYMNGNFEVEEYKKPEYEVRVSLAKPRVLQGESTQALIDARYYFGEPVNGGKVKYAIYRSRYWFPLWYEPDEEGETADGGAPDDNNSEDEQVAEGDGQLDADGKLTITVPTTVSDHRFDHRYRVEARVTDDAKREISGTGWLIATYGSFLVNIRPDRYFYGAGSNATFTVEARDYDSKPVQTKVRVEILKENRRDPEKTQVVAAADAATGAEGSAAVSMTLPAQGGSYRVRVRATTPERREVEDVTYAWVEGKGDTDLYSGSARKTVQIIPDKKSYRPGDTAKLLIITGQADTSVLVTVEGRDLRSHQVIRSKGATAVFEVPIRVEDEPGFYVTAQYIRGGELYQSSKRVKAPPEEHKLNVKVASNKAQYLPGETATYTLDVTDSSGKPAPRAEFSLGVVDEAIYAIRRDATPDILTFFYGHEYNSVYTTSSLEYYFSGEAGKRRMRLAMLRPPSHLAQLKPERLVRPKVRKVFPDTAFWNAALITDAAGHAVAKMPFPDSLTTWRATLRGIAPGDKVGNVTMKTIVRKNLILRLALPRFFVQGDEVVISALVHNYLTTDKTARVSLKLDGLDVMDGKTQDVTIPSRGEVKLDWRVRAQSVRQAMVHGEALTDEESDALELDLPVNPPGVKLALAKGGTLTGAGAAAFALTFPARVEPGSRSLSINATNSIAGQLFNALDYLTAFPYGCVEQTMSSFLPNIIVREAVSKLKLKTNLDEAQLREKIRAGLDRLYSFQHEDGGWGWWETDDSHPFMTAYVVAGLMQAKAAGAGVNDEAVKKGAAWLGKHNDTKYAPDLRAYIAYAMSLAGEKAPPLPELARLSPYGLGLAGLMAGTDKGAIANLLEQRVQQNDQEAWWPSTRDELLDFAADATPESTAYAVKFLSRQRPASPLLPKAALWLMNHRNEGYWWSSTKQTAMVIYGLIDYLQSTNELNSNLTATIYVNDRKVEPGVTLDEVKLAAGENRIRIVTAGQGRLYYAARAEYYSSEPKLQKAGRVSLNLLRDYFKLVPGKDGDKIVYDSVPLTGGVASGDIIAVRLTVTGSDWKYLLVEDPIPAGTEFIERDQLYQMRSRPPWWQYWFTRREMHDDRMAIFQTYFNQGQREYFYLLKVVNPGLFTASPARVQPMYQPEFLSTTESRKLEVR